MLASLKTPARRTALATLALMAVACAPTKLVLRTDPNGVDQIFVVADEAGEIAGHIDEGTLGSYAQNLSHRDVYDFASFVYAERGQTVDYLDPVHTPETDWMRIQESADRQEVVLHFDNTAIGKRSDLGIGIIVLANDAQNGQRYFGRLLSHLELEPNTFLGMSKGKTFRVKANNDTEPYVEAD